MLHFSKYRIAAHFGGAPGKSRGIQCIKGRLTCGIVLLLVKNYEAVSWVTPSTSEKSEIINYFPTVCYPSLPGEIFLEIHFSSSEYVYVRRGNGKFPLWPWKKVYKMPFLSSLRMLFFALELAPSLIMRAREACFVLGNLERGSIIIVQWSREVCWMKLGIRVLLLMYFWGIIVVLQINVSLLQAVSVFCYGYGKHCHALVTDFGLLLITISLKSQPRTVRTKKIWFEQVSLLLLPQQR